MPDFDPKQGTHNPALWRRPAFWLRLDCFVFVLAAGAVLLLLIWRASLASSLWADEIFSLVESTKPLRSIVEYSTLDRHPPGFHLFLKAWAWLQARGKSAGGVLWMRLPFLIAWVAGIVAAYIFGERNRNARFGLLLAFAAGFGTQWTCSAREIRAYGLVISALFICFLLLPALADLHSRNEPALKRIAAGWCAYAVLASFSLWNHFLSAPVLGLLGFAWLILLARLPSQKRRGFLIGGLAAQVCALASFLPWAATLPANLARTSSPEPWMTPPTLANLLRVPALWYPLGRRAGESLAGFPVSAQLALGIASFALPIAALILTLGSKKPEDPAPPDSALIFIAAAGIGIALANVFIIWGLARWAGMATFHGPRYACLTAPFWGAGLAAAAFLAAKRLHWKRIGAWALLSPWLLASALGFSIDAAHEATAGFSPYLHAAGIFPPPRTTLFIMPGELLDCYSSMLRDWRLRPIESLAETLGDGTTAGLAPEACILNLNNWTEYMPERDLEILSLMRGGKLASTVEPHFLPPGLPSGSIEFFTLFHLKGIDAATVKALQSRNFLSPQVAAPPQALAVVHPRDLLRNDGWYALTMDSSGYAQRWSTKEEAKIRLPSPLSPGRYAIHLSGYKSGAASNLLWRIGDQDDWLIAAPAPGWFDVKLPLEIPRLTGEPLLEFKQPLSPVNVDPETGQAAFHFGFLFHGLWIEKVGEQ